MQCRSVLAGLTVTDRGKDRLSVGCIAQVAAQAAANRVSHLGPLPEKRRGINQGHPGPIRVSSVRAHSRSWRIEHEARSRHPPPSCGRASAAAADCRCAAARARTARQVSRDRAVRWSINHASYAGTAPGACIGRGIVAGVPDLFVLHVALPTWLRSRHPLAGYRTRSSR